MNRDSRDPQPVLRKAAAAVLRGSRMVEQAVGLFERAVPDDAPTLEMDLIKAQEMLPRWVEGELLEAVATLQAPIQAAVVDVLAEKSAVSALLGLESQPLDRAAQKAAHHALTPLRDRGVLPFPPPRGEARSPEGVENVHSHYVAAMGPADAAGQSHLLLACLGESKGTWLANVLLDEERGIARFWLIPASRKQVKGLFRESLAEQDSFLTVVPVAVAVAQLLRSRALAESVREPLSQSLLDFFHDLPPLFLEEGAAHDLEAVLKDVPIDLTRLSQSLGLMGVSLLREWRFPRAACEKVRSQIQEESARTLIVSGMGREERLRESVARGIDTLLEGGVRQAWVERYRRLAVQMVWRGWASMASVALTTARCLEEGKPEAWRIPVVAGHAVLSLRLPEIMPILVAEGILPARPTEAPSSEEESGMTVTPSGLITPTSSVNPDVDPASRLILPGR